MLSLTVIEVLLTRPHIIVACRINIELQIVFTGGLFTTDLGNRAVFRKKEWGRVIWNTWGQRMVNGQSDKGEGRNLSTRFSGVLSDYY